MEHRRPVETSQRGAAPTDIRQGTSIAVHNVTKRFGDTTALHGISLSVSAGEMVALVGPDGAGKTTLLRILAGVLRQDEGSVVVLDTELPKHSRAVKTHLGYLAQGFSLYGDLSVDENMAFFAEIYGMKRYAARREELLDFTRLAPFRNRLAGRLSGGMKKKLALACALIHNPQVILLDEPTTGVDPVTRRDFWVILSELLDRGLTIVVATPYLDEAERCERVALLQDGAFLALGTPEHLKEQIPGRLFEVITTHPRRARAALATRVDASAPLIPDLLEVQAQGDRLHIRISPSESDDPIHAIRQAMERADVPVSSVRETPPTLENVYVSLVSGERRGERDE